MMNHNGRISRRDLLKRMGIGAAALAMGNGTIEPVWSREPAGVSTGAKKLFQPKTDISKVALIKGNDCRDNIVQALKKIEDDVLAAIGGKQIVIKPNFVSTDRELSATHVDAIRGILDVLAPHCKKQIIVGESTASNRGTFDGFKNYGYTALEKEYNVKLVDLNQEPWEYRYVVGTENRPIPIRIISTYLDPNVYLVSAAKMKTHDRVVTTLSLKNVIIGAPVRDPDKNDKRLTHLPNRFAKDAILHYNMFHLAQEIYPGLGVIDGFTAMEGNGPVGGTPVEARVALASTDPLALDVLTTKMMGFDPTQIMYLSAMAEAGMGQGDLTKISVLGTPVEQCQYKFKISPQLEGVYDFG